MKKSPIETGFVCNPWKVPSREISRHHWYIVKSVIKFPKTKRFIEYWWNHFVNPAVRVKAPIAPVKGHGLKSTKWNGWLECDVVIVFNI